MRHAPHTRHLLAPGHTQLLTCPSPNMFPVSPAQTCFCFLVPAALACCVVSVLDSHLLNSSERSKAGTLDPMVGTVRWKAKAPSLLRKSVAIVCESSTHFLLPFSSLAIPVSTQPRTEQAASDTEVVLWLDFVCRGRGPSRDTSRQPVTARVFPDELSVPASLLGWVTGGLHKGQCGTCQAGIASTRSRWMLLGLRIQAVVQHTGPCPHAGGALSLASHSHAASSVTLLSRPSLALRTVISITSLPIAVSLEW